MVLLFWLLATLQLAVAMPPGDFSRLQAQVDDEAFGDDQVGVIRTAASANTFTSAQVVQLLGELSFAKDQLAALEHLAPRLEDPGNKHLILDAFTFSSDKQKAEAILASGAGSAPSAGTAPARPSLPQVGSRPSPSPPATRPAPSHGAPSIDCSTDASLPPLEFAFTSTWPDADFERLMTGLQGESFSDDRLARLRMAVESRPESLSGAQVRRILGAFDFSSDLEQVLGVVDPHLTGITVAEVASILDEFDFSDGKLKALDALEDTITDVEHKHELLGSFTFSSDKEKARAMLDQIKPRSFLYGTVHSQNVVFVVDVSGSMEATFRTNQGLRLSRLDFVRCELAKVVDQHLVPGARFNVITFAGGVDALHRDMLAATPAQVDNARHYLAQLHPHGGTNIYGALEAAFSLRPDTIYFLTDGAPTAGPTEDPTRIVEAARNWSGGRTKVHAIAFLTGSHRGDDKPTSRRLMFDLAEATGGAYRALE